MDNKDTAKNAPQPSLTKTAHICFWLSIATLLCSYTELPLTPLLSAFHAVLMLRLGSIDPHFRTAGMVEAVSIAAPFLIPSLPAGIWNILRSVVIHALNLLWAYHAFAGFSKALADIEPELSVKWRSSRNWYICANAVADIGITLYSYMESPPKLILILAIFVSEIMEIIICINYWNTSKLSKQHSR